MLQAIFLHILNMSFTASLVILAVLILRLALKKTPKLWAYLLWAVVLLRLLLPISFELPASLIPGGQLIAPESLGERTLQISSGVAALDMPVNSYLLEHYYEGATAPVGAKLAAADIAAFIWLAGVLVIAAAALTSLLLLHRRLTGAIRQADNTYQTDAIAMPFVLGLWRPRIYLPADLAEAEKPYILLHEQCHIRRGDHLIKLLAFAALTLHWFNPLVWLAYRLSMLDMEMSCDESVLAKLPQEIRLDYSESLLRLSGRRQFSPLSPLAFGESDPARRIKNLLNYKKPTLWLTVIAAIVVVIGCAALIGNKPGVPSVVEDTDLNGLLAAKISSLADGQTAAVEITPELRQAIFELGRAEYWQYLPQFTEGAPPQTPDAYLLQMYMQYPYENCPLAVEPGTDQELPYISAGELDAYVLAHFGVTGLEHSNDYYLKPFSYADGKYFASPFDYYMTDYELTGLTVSRQGDQIIYDAAINGYDFGTLINYGQFCAVQGLDDAAYEQYYAELLASSHNSAPELAVLDAYGRDIQNGTLTAHEAVRRMIVDGDTADFAGVDYHETIYLRFSLPASAHDFTAVLYLQNIVQGAESAASIMDAASLQTLLDEYLAEVTGSYSQNLIIVDSEITTLEQLPATYQFSDLPPITVYKLAYRFRTDDPRAEHTIDGIYEDGWLYFPEGMEDYLAVVVTGDRTGLLTTLTPAELLQSPHTVSGIETALRAKLEAAGLLTGPTYDGDHQIAELHLSTGETCKLLLSQPATQGASGIWCVERWQDGSGTLYYNTPPITDDSDERTAAEYYADQQTACDNGHQPWRLDYTEVAYQFVHDSLNQTQLAMDDLRFVPLEQNDDAYALFSTPPTAE